LAAEPKSTAFAGSEIGQPAIDDNRIESHPWSTTSSSCNIIITTNYVMNDASRPGVRAAFGSVTLDFSRLNKDMGG
jgi:hypothetical protein